MSLRYKHFPELWSGYDLNKLPPNFDYWVTVWEELFETENIYAFRLDPTTIHTFSFLLYRDIKISKQVNRVLKTHIIRKKLKKVLVEDLVCIDFFSKEIADVQRLIKTGSKLKLQETETNELSKICKHILKVCGKGMYFDRVFKELKKELFSNNPTAHSKMRALCINMIIEYLFKGHSLLMIKDFPRDIFVKRSANNHSYLKVCLGITIDRGESLENRVEILKRIFYVPKKQGKAIFLILGAKGDTLTQIGDVILKPPLEIEDGTNPPLWVFNSLEKEFKNKPFLRAVISIEGVDLIKEMNEARDKVLATLNYLRFKWEPRDKIIVSRTYAILDKEGNVLHQMPSFDANENSQIIQERMEFQDPLNVSEHYKTLKSIFQKQQLKFTAENCKQSFIKTKLLLSWFTKSIETEKKFLGETLLINWVCFETLGKKIGTLKESYEALSKFYTIRIMYEFLKNTKKLLESALINRNIEISNSEFKRKYGLVTTGTVTYSLKEFAQDVVRFRIIEDISSQYLREKLVFINKLVEDREFQLEQLEFAKDNFLAEIDIIERYRNMIVHSGFEGDPLLFHYRRRIYEINKFLLQEILRFLEYYPHCEVSEIIECAAHFYDLAIAELKGKKKFDVFTPFWMKKLKNRKPLGSGHRLV